MGIDDKEIAVDRFGIFAFAIVLGDSLFSYMLNNFGIVVRVNALLPLLVLFMISRGGGTLGFSVNLAYRHSFYAGFGFRYWHSGSSRVWFCENFFIILCDMCVFHRTLCGSPVGGRRVIGAELSGGGIDLRGVVYCGVIEIGSDHFPGY